MLSVSCALNLMSQIVASGSPWQPDTALAGVLEVGTRVRAYGVVSLVGIHPLLPPPGHMDKDLLLQFALLTRHRRGLGSPVNFARQEHAPRDNEEFPS